MKIRLLLCICLVSFQVAAQNQKLSELKSELLHTTGTRYADCLNKISEEYFSHILQSDSALKYAELAYAAASREKDQKAKALSFIWRGQVQGHLLGNLDLMEEYGK